MSSHPRPEPPDDTTPPRVAGDSSAQAPDLPPVEDILSAPMPPTDDTPTIITRHVMATPPPATQAEDSGAGIRGRRLAHFELIEPIGVGGMAAVLRARDTQLDRLVALKILPPETASDAENVRRFHQEARSAARLDHENIARVFFCGEDQRLHFIAFEYVEGENLRALIDRRGRLPVAEAIHYMLQIAAGLAHASRRGVVHRDIKPSNIIITPNGRAKLVDMGLARTTERQDNEDLTQSGVTLGTFDYISPEQALEPREADVRSDIYSLGCTFYHVLTGRTPVPEGTAAKKLHHHQHVKPTDPRDYVPDLPIEVVQILDRMMAKNPRDRVQTPEELVHQLLVTAKKLGANPEVPEGLLTFEATLPTAPAGRPLVWAAIAAALVIGLVLALDQAPSGRPDQGPSARSGPEVSDGKSAGKAAAASKPSEEVAPVKGAEPARAEARYVAPEGLDGQQQAQRLVAWLAEQAGAEELTLELAGELDLSQLQKEEPRGLRVKAARKVTIRPKQDGGQVTIRFNYDSGGWSKTLVALTLNARETSIKGVRFVVDAHASGVELTALRLLGEKHNVERCVFVQAQPSPNFASVHADASASSPSRRSEVTISDSAFLGFGKRLRLGEGSETHDEFQGAASGGQVAIARDGAARITARNCVFGPHTAVVRATGNSPDAAWPVTLEQCSLLLGPRRSSAFEVAGGATGQLAARGCLLARAPGEIGSEAGDGAVMIRQLAEGRDGDVGYQGTDNSYHDLDGYWLVGDRLAQAGWGAFRARFGPDGERIDKSRNTLCHPWLAEASEQLRLLEQEQLAKAFELNLRLSSLRRPGRMGAEVVGATKVLAETWLPDPLPPLDRKANGSNRRLLVVETGYEDDPDNGVFDSISRAVSNGRPFDTISLRVGGDVKVDPVSLNKVKDLTIRPARRFSPTLILGEATDQDAALFRVFDGTLRLEGLEFRLEPAKGSEFKAQAVVALAGDGACLMRDCVVTMGTPGETSLALAMLVESSKVMKSDMPPARPRERGPELSLTGCLVRGEGDLLWGRANRPFGLKLEDTLSALAGSVVNFEAGPDAVAAPEGQYAQVQLKQSTTYLGGHLLHVNVSKDPRGLVPMRCRASECLFLPATTGKTLVQLEGPEGEEKALRDKFSWEGGHNGYGAYTSLLAQDSGEGMATPMGMDKWKMLPGEDMSTFGVKMKKLPPVGAAFAAIDAGQFEVAQPDTTHYYGATGKAPRRRGE